MLIDDRSGPAARTRRASFIELPASPDPDLLAAVRSASASANTVIVADSDRWLRSLIRWGDELRRAGFLVLHPDAPTLEICLGKSVFLQWCHAQQLPAPQVYDPALPAGDHPGQFPLLLRPEQTQHSNDTGLPKAVQVDDRAELAAWLGRFAAVGVTPNVCESLLQRRLRQFSIGAARTRAGHTLTFAAEKVRPDARMCAGGTYVRPVAAPSAEHLAIRALDALDFFGIAEVEVLHDVERDESFLIEVNARPWLQYPLPHACGCDLLGHVLGEPNPMARPARAQRSWLYWWPDLRTCFARNSGLVRSGQLRLSDYLQSIARPNVYPVWDWRDPAPLLSATQQFISRRLSRH